MRKMMGKWLPAFALAAVLGAALPLMAACDSSGGKQPAPGETFDTAGMDTSVRAGDDFYRYASGRWLDTHPIAADWRYRDGFTEIYDKVQEQLKGIISGAAGGVVSGADMAADADAQKVGDLYSLFMDTARLENEGAAPLRPLLDQIEALDSGEREYKAKLSRLIAEFHRKGIAAFFDYRIEADALDISRYGLTLSHGGYGPPKEFYTDRPELIDGELLTLMEKLLEYSGYPDSQSAARTVLGIHKTLAASACTTEELYRPDNGYHPVSLTELKAAVPALDWDVYFEVLGLPALTKVNLATNENGYFSAVNRVLAGDFANGGDLSGLKAYLRYRVLAAAERYLSADFYAATIEYDKAYTGIETAPERWKEGVTLVNDYMPETVGKLYVQQYFPAAYKARIRAMVENLQSAFAVRIENLEWMSDETKTEALAKLWAMRAKIGYPDTWRSFDALTIDKDKSLWENLLAVKEFDHQNAVDTFYDPVDNDKWLFTPRLVDSDYILTPQSVNGDYIPSDNSIVLSAALLQPPVFYPDGDDAINYGGIGMFIGHEITHGFDSYGRQYDLLGTMRDWWSSEDNAHFNTDADKLVALFNTFQVNGQSVNGQMTLVENIADRGGLAVAYDAWLNTLAGGEDADGAAGADNGGGAAAFTGKQRFFLSYARFWVQNVRPELQQEWLLSAPHAPHFWRIIGVLPHFDAWYEAFGITEGDALYIAPEDRIGSIW